MTLELLGDSAEIALTRGLSWVNGQVPLKPRTGRSSGRFRVIMTFRFRNGLSSSAVGANSGTRAFSIALNKLLGPLRDQTRMAGDWRRRFRRALRYLVEPVLNERLAARICRRDLPVRIVACAPPASHVVPSKSAIGFFFIPFRIFNPLIPIIA